MSIKSYEEHLCFMRDCNNECDKQFKNRKNDSRDKQEYNRCATICQLSGLYYGLAEDEKEHYEKHKYKQTKKI